MPIKSPTKTILANKRTAVIILYSEICTKKYP